jgi:predicted nucleic acid-binding protein
VADALVDSDILLDILTEDPDWYSRSSALLAAVAEDRALIINSLIYAEVSVGFDRIEDVDSAVPTDVFRRETLPWEAAFLAGKCFARYRRAGGSRRSPLPDFYIGAHAAVRGIPLLTRDAGRYRTYFPSLELVIP